MPPFDYVVSRGVIEHVPDGINAMVGARWTKRVMFDVPYDEPPDINQHHLLSRITAKDFAAYKDSEILYEEVSGGIYNGPVQTPIPNMILCVARAPGLPRVVEMLRLPIPAWEPPPGMRAMVDTITKLTSQLTATQARISGTTGPSRLLAPRSHVDSRSRG